MHQVKKGNEWRFGMKMHIGVDDALGLIHSVETTSANEHDITVADKLLQRKERRVWGDAGYIGIESAKSMSPRDELARLACVLGIVDSWRRSVRWTKRNR